MSRDLRNTRQPLNTFFAQGVLPFQKSPIILSAGSDTPYYYSLGNQSTVPFIRLQGSGGTQKEFTWGETIEVLPGQNVQVQSASYMHGDIQIQSGKDIANRPRRITVSVPVTPYPANETGEAELLASITPLFPCDTRQARSAWLGCSIEVGAAEASPILTIIGLNHQHSWLADVPSFYAGTIEPFGKKYAHPIPFQGGTSYHSIGLGFYAYDNPPDQPMHLPDFVTWRLDITDDARSLIREIFFYTLEY